MTSDSKYNSYVIKSILANNNFGIRKVNKLESIKVLNFNISDYSKIEEFIKDENFGAIEEESTGNDLFNEYLDIMKFEDQNNQEYIVTVYDSDEMWQDPEVIKIYPQTGISVPLVSNK